MPFCSSSSVNREPSVASSACSTASSAGKQSCLFSKIPKKPDEKDHKKWCNFLAAYQSGNWESAIESTRECSRQARKVQQKDGGWLDNRDFYAKYQYLAAPPAPKEKIRLRNETITRYNLTSGVSKPELNRYVRHARQVFRADYAAVSVACTTSRSTFFLAREGSHSDMANTATNTICDHAMLLEEDEVFVIPDLMEDWRFQHFQFRAQKGDALRFYASAPIVLSNAEDGTETGKSVQIGRLTIMRREPWKNFNEDDAHLLMDIAKMASESLENEFLQAHAKKNKRILRDLALLSYNLNLEADEDMTRDKVRDGHSGFLVCPRRMQRVVDLIHHTLGATTVVAVDVSDYRLQSNRSDSAFFNAKSPRGSIQYGAYPVMPWLRSSSSTGFSADEDALSSSLRTPSSESAGSEDLETAVTSPSEGGAIDLQNSDKNNVNTTPKRPLAHSRSVSTALSAEERGRYVTAPDTLPRIVVMAGRKEHRPSLETQMQSQDVGFLLTKLHRDQKLTKPQIFEVKDVNSLDEEDEENDGENKESDEATKNPLASLITPETKLYTVVPIFANDRTQPLLFTMAIFTDRKKISESERMFLYSTGVIVGGVCLRQQARLADSAQLDFIRSVQHELRTPLNGILGITDFLRQSLVSGDMQDKLDLTEDGLLASLLESIRLSGVNLSNILDDVLDFGAVSGIRNNQRKPRSIEEVDLVREIEDGCLDELEHIAMHERQDQKMKVYQGYYSVPTLVIKVAPELQKRFRTDRTKVKKILAKFVANALRYSNEHELVEVSVVPNQTHTKSEHSTDQWIDFIVQDTGIGMSQEFLNNSLLKPFSKADSFTQGVGLGVTIAASLISQMGGRLHIQSELGKGTKVMFSLPFGERPVPVSRRSLSISYRPYQIKTASFTGFVLKGQKKIVEMIRERLEQNGVRIVDSENDAELVILKETALAVKGGDEDDSHHAGANNANLEPTFKVPVPIGSKARVLVVTRNALRSRNIDALEGLPIWLFRPPFGPSSLDAMDEFLREESPIVLNSVPKPTPAAQDNMKRVQNKQVISGPTPASALVTSPLTIEAKEDKPSALSIARMGEAKASGGLESPLTPKGNLPEISNQDKPTNGTTSKRPDNRTLQSDPNQSTREKKPFRVLAVEDNYVNMRLITAVLTKGGYNFVEAKDGVEAVEQYKSFEPSVVLLDISLPLMDGFEACLKMRAHQMGHVPKIIAITALSSTEDKIKGLEVCGMDDWRTKPLSIKSLRTDLVVWKKEWDQVWSITALVGETAAAPKQVIAPPVIAAAT